MENNWNYEDPMDVIYAIRRMISERYGHDVRPRPQRHEKEKMYLLYKKKMYLL